MVNGYTNYRLIALRILFAAGWVHRDISHNNLLAFDDNGVWKLKLSDLEFSETLSHKKRRSYSRIVSLNDYFA